MDVTREEFEAYEEVRQSGITNMFDVKTVEAHSGLDRETILAIMEHYSLYKKYLHEWKNTNLSSVIEGTSKQGSMLATYEDVVAVYGKPITQLPDNKIDALWLVDTNAGIATIYNYKDGTAYLGEKGLDYKDIRRWHIGGHDKTVYDEVATPIYDYAKERFAA